jgi:hypothetical protein
MLLVGGHAESRTRRGSGDRAERRELRFRGDLGVAKASRVSELPFSGAALYSNGEALGVKLEPWRVENAERVLPSEARDQGWACRSEARSRRYRRR